MKQSDVEFLVQNGGIKLLIYNIALKAQNNKTLSRVF